MTARAYNARLYHPPPAASHRGDAHGGADRVHAVPLRRRSDQHDGRHRDHRRGTRRLREQLGLNDPIPIQFTRFVAQRGAAQFRQLVPVQDPGDRPDRRPLSGDHGAGLRLRAVLAADRHSDGSLHGAAPALVAVEHLSRRVAGRHFAADVPDRHPADLPVPGTLGVLPSFGRGDVVRLGFWTHRAADHVRAEGAGPARRSRSACSR